MEFECISAVAQPTQSGALEPEYRCMKKRNEIKYSVMAERVGFEPTVRLPVRRISSAVLSTTQPPLRRGRARRTEPASVGTRRSSSAPPHCLDSKHDPF